MCLNSNYILYNQKKTTLRENMGNRYIERDIRPHPDSLRFIDNIVYIYGIFNHMQLMFVKYISKSVIFDIVECHHR